MYKSNAENFIDQLINKKLKNFNLGNHFDLDKFVQVKIQNELKNVFDKNTEGKHFETMCLNDKMALIHKIINNDDAFKQMVIAELTKPNYMNGKYNYVQDGYLSEHQNKDFFKEEEQMKWAIEMSKQTINKNRNEYDDEDYYLESKPNQMPNKKVVINYEEIRKLEQEKAVKLRFNNIIIEQIKYIMERELFNNLTNIKLKNLIKLYESKESNFELLNQKIGNHLTEKYDQLEINDVSILALKLCQIINPEMNFKLIKEIINYFGSHIDMINLKLKNTSVWPFDQEVHEVDQEVNCLCRSFLMAFERVRIKGDGNCLWHSISVALFGDYSFMESFRLFTAATLVKLENYFRNHLFMQRNKYGYNHELNYEELVSASVQLGVWGDEYHLFTMSVALRRPIYSFGSMNLEFDGNYKSYERFKKEYEKLDFANHFRYVGYKSDEDKEPICIYYNGDTHYCAILPRKSGIDPIKPKITLFNYLIDEIHSSKSINKSESRPITQTELSPSDSSINHFDFNMINNPNFKQINQPDLRQYNQLDLRQINQPDFKKTNQYDSREVNDFRLYNKRDSKSIHQPDFKINQLEFESLNQTDSKSINQTNFKELSHTYKTAKKANDEPVNEHIHQNLINLEDFYENDQMEIEKKSDDEQIEKRVCKEYNMQIKNEQTLLSEDDSEDL